MLAQPHRAFISLSAVFASFPPVALLLPPLLPPHLQIACGYDHTMALAQDGTLFTFGSNSLAQLGRPSPPGGEHVQPSDAGAWLVNPEASCGTGRRFLRVGARLQAGRGW